MKLQALIRFTLSPVSPVIVASGSGNKLNPELPDHTFLMGWDGKQNAYVIPGSSLKGVIRHHLYKEDISDKDIDDMFGYCKGQESRKSRISVSDAYADMDSVTTTIRHSTAISSVTQGAKDHSLNNMQAVIDGNFSGTIRLRNVTKEELQTVLEALNSINTGEICVGGKISRGFGRMKVTNFKMNISGGFNESLEPINIGEYDSLTTSITAIKTGNVS